MYLFEQKKGNLNIYDMQPDQEKVIAFKKKYLEYIKAVIIHTNNENVVNLLDGPKIMFSALDRKKDGLYSRIELIDDVGMIDGYIRGFFDNIYPIELIGDVPRHKAYYSELKNEDYTLLYRGGSYQGRGDFNSSKSILLFGELEGLQKLLFGELDELNRLNVSDSLDLYNLFNYRKIGELSCDKVKMAITSNLVSMCSNYEKKLEISSMILSMGRRAKNVASNRIDF